MKRIMFGLGLLILLLFYSYEPYQLRKTDKHHIVNKVDKDIVHVLYKGRIVKTAGPELATEIEKRGYDWIKAEIGEE